MRCQQFQRGFSRVPVGIRHPVLGDVAVAARRQQRIGGKTAVPGQPTFCEDTPDQRRIIAEHGPRRGLVRRPPGRFEVDQRAVLVKQKGLDVLHAVDVPRERSCQAVFLSGKKA